MYFPLFLHIQRSCGKDFHTSVFRRGESISLYLEEIKKETETGKSNLTLTVADTYRDNYPT